MAFTFNSTSGDAAANSYSSVEDADNYFGGRYPNDYWTSLSSTDKQKVLATATRRLDAEMYSGRQTTNTQRLQFPREVIFDRDTYNYASDEIPFNLANAVYELGYFLLEADDRIMEEAELHDANMMDSYSVGPLTYGFNGKVKMDALPERVINELKAIGHGVWLKGMKVNTLHL